MRIALPTLFSTIAVPAVLLVPLSDMFSSLEPLAILRFPILLIAALIAFMVSTAKEHVKRLSVLLVTLSGFGLISTLWSQNLDISLQRALLNIAVTFFLVVYATAFSSASQLRIIITFATAVTLIVLFATAYGVIFKSSEAFFQGNFRGGFSNSNGLAQLIIVFSAPLCAAYLSEGSTGRKILWVLLLILLLIILVLTRSRGALLAFIVIAVFFVSTRRQFSTRFIFTASSAMALIYFSADMFEFFSSKYSSVSVGAFDTRLVLWKLHLAAIWERPVLGYGIGVNPVNFKGIEGYERDTEKGSSIFSLPEELGIPFFLTFVVTFLLLIVGPICRLALKLRERVVPTLNLLPVAVIFTSMTHGIFETWIFNFGNISALFFWMCLIFVLRFDSEIRATGQQQGR